MAGYSVTYSVVDNATKQIDAINRRITQMRAPIDRMSRSISRFVDVSGLRKVAEGFGWIARAGAAAFRSLMAIVPVLGAITSAATIAGMAKLVSSFSAWGRELAIAADQIGIAPQKLQQFQDAARLAGGSAEDMARSLQGLKDTSTRAFEGLDNDALAYFNRFGISLRDANGHLRNAADLLPEVMQKLQGIEDPTDRARVATALLGDAGAKLVESLRVSGKALGDWMTDASKFTELTQAQLQDMIKYEQAQGRLGVAFDHLGQQVAAVLAKNFIPLFDHLSDFVQQNQPQIIAAVDKISARFAKWLDNPDMWKNISDGITKTIDGLKWVIDNLDTVVRVAEDIAILFAVKWAVGIVASIAQVVAALGAVGGTGLLGALGTVSVVAGALAAIFATWAGNKAGQQSIEDQAKGMGFEQKSGGWFGMPTFHNPTTGEDLSYEQMLEKQGRPHGGGGFLERLWDRAMKGPESIRPPASPSSFTPTAPELTPEGKGLLTTIAAHESRGDYNVLYGGGHFAGSQFPQWEGKDNSHAAGAYQFQPATFAGVQRERPDIKDFSPANQDRAAWTLAQTDYHRRTGRDLTVDLKDPKQAENIARVLQPTWTSTNAPGWAAELQANLARANKGGVTAPPVAAAPPAAATPPRDTGGSSTPTLAGSNAARRDDWATNVNIAKAPPAAMPPAAPPVNGAVDVEITHRNPPPNAAVTATGSGSVNVAPPRVEHAALADI
jgi:muramidase (phage lysozyme)